MLKRKLTDAILCPDAAGESGRPGGPQAPHESDIEALDVTTDDIEPAFGYHEPQTLALKPVVSEFKESPLHDGSGAKIKSIPSYCLYFL
ncbi:hypothetical protein [Paraburkholderia sp. J63]|uniref:hypothetical protein n=1 Tax=Paraburkholderia sp. J63 TaxID=2805434 RepID=UPI002ABE528A|nr:hypothetical protein [Paraburkholderia sp. J63]